MNEEKIDKWKLRPDQIRLRVREIREDLGIFRDRLAAVCFDVVADDMPTSLDHGSDVCPSTLVELLNPCITGFQEICEAKIPREIQDELNSLKWHTADTAFAIGVLFGCMISGASEKEIDRLERGLVHATVSRRWQVTDE